MTHGIKVSEISENGQVIEKFSDRLRGRFLVGDVVDADTGEVLLSSTKMMDENDAKILETTSGSRPTTATATAAPSTGG